MTPVLEARGIFHRYEGREVLRGVDFSVGRGETVALIGPTGAGKSTLLRLLGLLEVPTAGEIIFTGHRVSGVGRERLSVRRRIGFVLQKPVLFNATVYDNVAQGLRWRGEKEPAVRGKVMSALERLGLSGLERRNARTLSGGEAQRVALARALVLEPEVLLLDEPTANLDPVSLSLVESLISSPAREYGAAVVIATHDLAQGQRLADRMAVLLEGRIVQEGRPEEVFAFPESRDVARLVGMENLFPGVVMRGEEGLIAVDAGGCVVEGVADCPPGERVYLGIRPEDITLSLSRPAASSARNCLEGRVRRIATAGPLSRVEVECGLLLVALLTRRSVEEMGLGEGSRVYASFKATAVHIIPRRSA